MKQRFVVANGVRLHYLDWGGDGPDLILSHPTGFVANIWQWLAERLRDRYHVLALDTRGHGESERRPGDHAMTAFVQDLRAFLEAVGLERPVGIGHSAGATAIAAVEAARPGSFARVVLMEPVLSYEARPQPRTLSEDALAAGTLKRRAVWPSRQEVYDSYRSRPPFASWNKAILWQYVEHGFGERADGSVELKCRPEDEAEMYLKGANQLAAGEFLPRVRCPVLLIRGEDSPTFTADDARQAVALLPNARLETMQGGHFAPFEHPDRAEAEVLRFLED